ncbi:MAG: histidine kinase dimerization/phosphoacceptor domain -containing protein [Ignavibacteriaceae bacterium]|nr:histidine kinase dimerization/phosphoacceptor domain -containing protein [Ignavibacteriaceae bacterium]
MDYSQLGKKQLIEIIKNYESKRFDDSSEELLLKNTKLKKMQSLLEQSRDLYANLYDYSPVGLITLDNKGIIKDINITLASMLGIERKHIPGTPFVVYLLRENVQEYLNYFREISLSKENGFIELKLRCKNDEIRNIQMYSKTVYDLSSETNLIQNTIIDVTDKKNNEHELERALKEKVVLLQEIHHRVKNNLQIINSLLSLQSFYVHDEHLNEIINTSKNRIKTMALIHENLYKENNLSDINFDVYLNKLIKNIFESYNTNGQKISLRNEIEEMDLNADSAIHVGLIVNELVTNSLKYAFKGKDKGEIFISFSKCGENRHSLIVSDNGIGLPAGFDITQDKTLGFLLVHSFVDQINGTMTLDQNKGTTFNITF